MKYHLHCVKLDNIRVNGSKQKSIRTYIVSYVRERWMGREEEIVILIRSSLYIYGTVHEKMSYLLYI